MRALVLVLMIFVVLPTCAAGMNPAPHVDSTSGILATAQGPAAHPDGQCDLQIVSWTETPVFDVISRTWGLDREPVFSSATYSDCRPRAMCHLPAVRVGVGAVAGARLGREP